MAPPPFILKVKVLDIVYKPPKLCLLAPLRLPLQIMLQPSWDAHNFLTHLCSFWLEFFLPMHLSDLYRPVASLWPPAQESAPGGLSWPPKVGSDASSLIEPLLLSIPSYYLCHGMWSPFYRKPSLTALASENLSRQTHILFTITSSASFMIPYNKRLPIKYSESDWDNRSWIRSVLEGRNEGMDSRVIELENWQELANL